MRKLIFLSLVATFALIGTFAPVLAQDPPRDKCHDENLNDHCPRYESFDGRINQFDPMAAVSAYCRPGPAIDVWGITDREGQYLFSLDAAQIAKGLSQAKDRNAAVVINEKNGRGVRALPGWRLEMYGTAANGLAYSFVFDGNYCGAIPYMGTGGQRAPAAPPAAQTPPPSNVSAPAAPAGQFVTTVQGGNIIPPAGFAGVQAVTNHWVRFRSAPRIEPATFIEELGENAALTIWGRDRRSVWLLVVHEGRLGWVAAQYVALTPAQIARLPLVVGQ
jgi:hypothetical protein